MQSVKTWFPGLVVLAFGSVLLSGCGGGGSGTPAPSGVTVSGQILIEPGSRVDSDTADDLARGAATRNNSPQFAQELPWPALAGGYVSATGGRYPDGGTYAVDENDYFKGQFRSGDRVALSYFLSLPDGEGRICLELDGAEPQCKEAGEGSESGQILQVFSEGAGPDALIRVRADAGAPFRYVLQVVPEGASGLVNLSYAEPDIALDEALLLTPGDATRQAVTLAGPAVGAPFEVVRAAGRHSVQVTRPALARQQVADHEDLRGVTVAWIRQLQAAGYQAEPNYLFRTQTVTPDTNPLYRDGEQLSFAQISVPLAWHLAPVAGAGVGVAVLDTGLFYSTPGSFGDWHPDLAANVVTPGGLLDFVTPPYDQDAETGRDNNPATPANGLPQATSFHGTHVAGIIAAEDNDLGVVGVAPSATLVPVRVLGSRPDQGLDGVGSSADLVAAIETVASRSDVDVINLSLGGLGPSQSLWAALQDAEAAGVLVVAAGGNSGTAGATYPARFSSVVGVGAVNLLGERTWYSNFGEGVDVYAPGGDSSIGELITSAYGREVGGQFSATYARLQGTSMAAPHVSGIYALMKSVDPELTPAQFRQLLAQGRLTDAPVACPDCGYGLINAALAVEAVLGDEPLPDFVVAEPSVLALNAGSAVEVRLRQGGGEPLRLAADVLLPEPLELKSADTDSALVAGELLPERIELTVDRETFVPAEGLRREVRIAYGDSGAELLITVFIRPMDEPGRRNAGRHYVLMISLDDDRPPQEVAVTANGSGQYDFRFDDVLPGDYYLVAGSDLDNNLYLCEPGEACAEYPVNGRPEILRVGSSNISNLQLNTSYQRATIEELGLPRFGFRGYQRPADGSASTSSGRRLR